MLREAACIVADRFSIATTTSWTIFLTFFYFN
jgi:hypothetical protein